MNDFTALILTKAHGRIGAYIYREDASELLLHLGENNQYTGTVVGWLRDADSALDLIRSMGIVEVVVCERNAKTEKHCYRQCAIEQLL